MNAPSFRASILLPGLGAGLALLAASCGSDGGGGGIIFQSRSTKQGVAQQAPIVISERWLAYLADEASTGAGGSDFNADGDVLDQIAVLVNMASQGETVLDVAADELVMLGGQLFLVTNEAEDQKDWDLDGTPDDLVLLHVPMQTATPATVAYVATLNPAGVVHALATNGRLYFVDVPAAPLVAPDTALAYVTAAAPTTIERVANADGANTLEAPRLHAEDDGLLFVTLDENVEARDLNADTDMTDAFVLGVLDATDAAAMVMSTGLAVRDAIAPVEALSTNPNDWLVGFLVDEAAQGGVSLNSWGLFGGMGGTWNPTQCAIEDADTTDEVLHYLNYQLFLSNPMANDALENTGIAGADRVLVVRTQTGGDYVATITPEDANCDLNQDGDFMDRVFRWTRAQFPVLPFNNEMQLRAVADVAGGTHGVSDLNRRFVIVVSEADENTDLDGDAMLTHDLVAWLNPALGAGATWTFDHNGTATNGFVGTAWMADRDERDRLLVAFQEAVAKLQVNPGGDADMLDSAPTAARFDPTNANDLDFPGPMVAVDMDNAGITIENGLLFYRVSELEDNRDWNGDGMKNDFVLFRTTVATLQNSSLLASLNGIARPAVASGGNVGVAYVADETMGVKQNGTEGVDFNGDGDTNDFVVRWLRIGP
jgi:hypothetical protein